MCVETVSSLVPVLGVHLGSLDLDRQAGKYRPLGLGERVGFVVEPQDEDGSPGNDPHRLDGRLVLLSLDLDRERKEAHQHDHGCCTSESDSDSALHSGILLKVFASGLPQGK